jgi:hypothetical protein
MNTWWSEGVDLLIPKLDIKCGSVMRYMPRSVSPWGNSPGYPLKKRLRGSHNQSPYFGDVKNLFLLPGIEKRLLGFLGRSLVTTPTKSSR